MAENINININAKDNASTTIGNVNKNIQGLSAAAVASQKGVAGLTTAFASFKTVIAGLAIGATVTNAFQLADSMVDLGNATNLTTQSILGFSQAVALNGGELQQAQIGLTKFTQLLGDARNGVDSAQKRFADLGVSIQDIQSLSEEDVLRKTVQGLGNVDDTARRSAAAVDIFGRSFASVDIASVNQQFDEFVRRSGASAVAIQKAGEVQGRFNDSIQLFQIQLLTALEPLSELALSITKNQAAISEFLDTLIKVSTVVAAIFGANMLGKFFVGLGNTLRTLPALMAGITGGFNAIRNSILQTGKLFDRLFRGTLGSRGGGTVRQFTKEIGFMIMSLGRLAPALVAAAAAGAYFGNILRKEVFTNEGDMERLVERVRQVREEVGLLNEEQAQNRADEAAAKIAELTAQYERLKEQQANVAQGFDALVLGAAQPMFAGQIEELEQQLDYYYDLRNVARLRVNQIQEEAAASEAAAEQAQALYEAEQRRQDLADEAARNIQNTIDTIAGLKEELKLLGLNERQQAIYNATKQAGNNATLEELALISSLAGEIFDITAAREEDAAAIEAQVEAQQQMQAAINQLAESYQEAIAASETFVKNKQAEFDYQNKINTTYGVTRDVLEQLAQFDQERISNLERLKIAAQEAAAAGVEGAMDQYNAAVEAYERQRQAFEELARDQAEIQNSAIQGIKESLAGIADDFTPYNMAQDAILSTWGKIGNAIDEVASGGKASFKDLARSVIADLGAMIAKASVFAALKTAFAAFGFSLPGLANGGPAQAGKPYMVGEKGPELFVPKQSGTVIPNNQLGSQAQAQAQPATVVNNVYNISAVDAKSVAQLFYENRRTMLGTLNIAQKELPYGAMG